MSGMPAARMIDLTVVGPIIQGSLTVLIGSAGGKACAVCPGGIAVGNPVNPALGAKVLMGFEDLDAALPGPLGLVWQRQYSSYVNEEHAASCGVFGYGWKQALELWLEHEAAGPSAAGPEEKGADKAAAGTRLFDAAGRCISFGSLAPGQSVYSESEDLWLMRGGAFEGLEASNAQPGAQNEQLAWAQQARWAHLPRAWRGDAGRIFAASAAGNTVWAFRPSAQELDKRWRLQAVVDRFGRSQELGYAQEGPEAGLLTDIKDGAGRRYRLSYQRVRAEHPEQEMAGVKLGADSGLRLTAIHLIHNPEHNSEGQSGPWQTAPSPERPWELVSYRYNASGDLEEVTDRSGQMSRRFEYDSAHRMVMHQERSGVKHRYVYEDSAGNPQSQASLKAQGHVLRPGARVIAQNNEAGELSYRFEYLQAKDAEGAGNAHSSACRVSDSLGRVSLYHFEGSAGLKRLVSLIHPDASQESWGYDAAGRKTRHTDELGRETHWRYDGRGQVLGVQGPGGEHSSQSWGEPGSEQEGLLLSSSDTAGRVSQYRYDRWGRLVEHQIGNGEEQQRTQWRYAEPDQERQDQKGRNALAWIEHPTEITDARGGKKQLGYNGSGQLTHYTDCSGQSSSWRFDVWGDLIESQNALGHKERHDRDEQGRVVRTLGTDGRELRMGYNAQGQLQSIEQSQPGSDDEQRSTITFEHNRHGQLLNREHGGLGIALRYDEAGRLKTLVNENAAQTEFSYDARDRLQQEVGFDGRIQRNQYDAAGQLIGQWDGMAGQSQAIESRYLHDKAGRLVLRLSQRQTQNEEPNQAQNQDPDPIEAISFDYDKGQLSQASHWQLAPELPAVLKKQLQEQPQRQENQPQDKPAQPENWFDLSSEQLPRAWQASQGQSWLQATSKASLQRDSLGRLVGERQRLRAADAPHWEHHISHRLGPLGQRHSSELQGMGEIHWQSYGSGHVHGLLLGHNSLIDIERDSLHREIGRRLHLLGADPSQDQAIPDPTSAPIKPISHLRQLDAQGRLLSQQLQGASLHNAGPQLGSATQISQAHQPLIGAALERHYRYDALGQLVAVRSPAQHLWGSAHSPAQQHSYRYDAAQRLIAAAHSQLQEGQTQPLNHVSHWRIDPAGNRLPGLEEAQNRTWNDPKANAEWGEQVKRQLHNKDFDLLERRPEGAAEQGPVEAWRDNRIAWNQGVRYRYDGQGNRIQAQHPDGSEERYRYNALGQLIEHSRTEPAGEAGLRSSKTQTTRYRYDPFGRRLSKTSEAEGQSQTTPETIYYGWDGDRLVHVEDARQIRHTVYESGSFVPMVQLQRSKGAKNIAQITMGEEALSHLAPAQQEQMQAALKKALKTFDPQTASGLHQSAQSAMNTGWGPEMNQLVRQGFESLQAAQVEEEAKYPIQVRHILCDHLGTPMALIDATGAHKGQITWAARYGAWGDVEVEYNPYNIEQPIRFQGQQFDEETGLHYNRFRYYDPAVGSYVTQDPIGLEGGINTFQYVGGVPILLVDPRGLDNPGMGVYDTPKEGYFSKKFREVQTKDGLHNTRFCAT